MIKRSFDLPLLLEATKETADVYPQEDFITWFNMPTNLMFEEDGNVGLATLEYPGVYSLHWYFKVRGRAAIELAQRMVKNLFDNYGAKSVRGLIRKDFKASRWACRQVGLKSFGFIETPKGEVELFCATRDEFFNSLEGR